jgi:hypothetical protein
MQRCHVISAEVLPAQVTEQCCHMCSATYLYCLTDLVRLHRTLSLAFLCNTQQWDETTTMSSAGGFNKGSWEDEI